MCRVFFFFFCVCVLLNAVIIGYVVVVDARTMGFLAMLILDYCLRKWDFENIVVGI